jgi:hypothetical protein
MEPGPGVMPRAWLAEAFGLRVGDRVEVAAHGRWRAARAGRVVGAIAARAAVELEGYGVALVDPGLCRPAAAGTLGAGSR